MKRLFLPAAASLLTMAAGFSACESSGTSMTEPGASLIDNSIEVVIDSSFTITAQSVPSGAIQSRTTTQLFGAINAPEYGTLRADFVAQMFPSNNIETEDVTPDSLKLQLVFAKEAFVGDSLAPIGIEVYPLVKQLPDPIYSDYNPAEEQAYDSANLLGEAAFTAVGISVSDTVAGNPYRFAYVPLPDAMMTEIFNKFKADPTLFNNPYDFQDYFPGVYVRHTFGSGRVTRINDCRIVLYYHKTFKVTDKDGVETDSISKLYNYCMAMAPELVSNTCIDYTPASDLTSMANGGKAIIAAPGGYDVQFKFPIESILNTIKAAGNDALTVVNTLSFTLPAKEIESARGIVPPTYLLLVPSKDKAEFFAKNKLPDNKTTFIGTYNETNDTYSFGDMREYLLELMNSSEPVKEEDYTFTLTPVSLVMESSQTSYYSSATTSLSGITPMIAMPAMVELLPATAKIKLTFSRQSL